jgi:predicted  nucleic acid-binding Zn-ribbon protein
VNIDKEIDRLVENGNELKASSSDFQQLMKLLQDQLKYVEKNQADLQEAINHYESSLESVTQKMGDGFGSIVDYHMASSYQTLNNSLHSNIDKITSSNQELVERMQTLFEQLAEQSQNETSAIVNMNDQMNLHFEALDNKLL